MINSGPLPRGKRDIYVPPTMNLQFESELVRNGVFGTERSTLSTNGPETALAGESLPLESIGRALYVGCIEVKVKQCWSVHS
ncbi:hypothetical protein C481_17617 [Natrialba asiatica DSM 12278]|uniref:Uncharacterized protein n=1 Tax=Natrialba asiatica (strain ATCC 700177 / DSM 12278 / JCM 9576 / FERM P-10747 / NBRC 102637 / 172P1) TaxID=29540 RepID=M0AJC4_NATA1|nr:hypothetical protein C481_17617 [Natrialba asiatica DSM 12278]